MASGSIDRKLLEILTMDKTLVPSLDALLVRSMVMAALAVWIRKFNFVDVCMLNLMGQISICLFFRLPSIFYLLMMLEAAWVGLARIRNVRIAYFLVAMLMFIWDNLWYALFVPHPYRIFMNTLVLLACRTFTTKATSLYTVFYILGSFTTYCRYIVPSSIDILLFFILICYSVYFATKPRSMGVCILAYCIFIAWMSIKVFRVPARH